MPLALVTDSTMRLAEFPTTAVCCRAIWLADQATSRPAVDGRRAVDAVGMSF